MTEYRTELVDSFELELSGEAADLEKQLGEIYQEMGINYPKFYKMNVLCKLGFIGAEKITSNNTSLFSEIAKDQVATIFFNRSSSLVSDHEHMTSIHRQSIPSPAVFVYTLPNILNGEIAIRNEWTGYSAFYLMENYEASKIDELVNIGRHCQSFSLCLAGWVETDLANQKYSLKIMLYKVN